MSFRAITESSVSPHSLKTTNMAFGENFHGIPLVYILLFTVLLSVVNCLNCQQITRDISLWLPDAKTTYSPVSQRDSDMKICYNGGGKNKKSCCTSETENQYLQFGDRQIRKLVSFEHFKKTLTLTSNQFKNGTKDLENGLIKYVVENLLRQFWIPKTQLEKTVVYFVTRLLSNNTKIKEEEELDKFLGQIRPLVYYMYFKRGSPSVLAPAIQNCLAHSFREYRKNTHKALTHKMKNEIDELQKAKRAIQRFRETIALFIKVLKRLEKIPYPKKCLEDMARNHLCPACFGIVNSTSVCLKTCQKVFQGCHRHWIHLQPAFDRFVDGARRLATMIISDWNLSNAIKKIVSSIINTFNEEVKMDFTSLDLEKKLMSDCFPVGFTIQRTDTLLPEQKSNSSSTNNFPEFPKKFLSHFLVVMQSKSEFFKKQLRKPCLKLPSDNCWNGTDIYRARYNTNSYFASNRGYSFETSQGNGSPRQMRVVSKLNSELNRYYSFSNPLERQILVREAKKEREEQQYKEKEKKKNSKSKRKRGKRRKHRNKIEGSGHLPESPEGSGPPDDERDNSLGSGSGDTAFRGNYESFPDINSNLEKGLDEKSFTIVTKPGPTAKLSNSGKRKTTTAPIIMKPPPVGKARPSYNTPKSRTVVSNRGQMPQPSHLIVLLSCVLVPFFLLRASS